MKFSTPLTPAILLRRYKRFLADVDFGDGAPVVAHCANPGAMLGLANQGAKIWLAPSPNPKAKLDWRWELEDIDGTLVGINTSHPNRLVEEAISSGVIEPLTGYNTIRREVRYGANSRIDLLLERGDQKCFVEVKNVHWKRADLAVFPDCVTARGAKHLDELAREVGSGHRAVMIYCIQRSDCRGLDMAGDIDPGYLAAFGRAHAAGVEAYAYECSLSTQEIIMTRRLPLELTADSVISRS
jgi:sugar fermentation stimulation protein A